MAPVTGPYHSTLRNGCIPEKKCLSLLPLIPESQLIWPELVFLKAAMEEILTHQKIMNAYTPGTGVGWGGGGSVRYKKMAASHNFFEA